VVGLFFRAPQHHNISVGVYDRVIFNMHDFVACLRDKDDKFDRGISNVK